MKISVIGCGYVGLITGVGMALKGHDVTAIDVSASRIDSIKKKIPPFHEPGLKAALEKVLKLKKLQATTDNSGVGEADVILIAVGTPSAADGSIDLSLVRQVVAELTPSLKASKKRQVLVIRSTVVPGTLDSVVAPLVAQINASRSQPLGTAVNPEFLREGRALDDFLSPDRVVIGSTDAKAAATVAKLYDSFDVPVIKTSPTAAEMIKYTSNTLLAVLISFSNEIARICESLPNVDADEVFRALHLDRRLTAKVKGKQVPVGITSYLRAGCGYGGSCLPKDLRAILAFARSKKIDVKLLESANNVNTTQPAHFVDLAERWAGPLKGRKVAVLGLSFKEGTDDFRESPGLAIAQNLLERGASLIVSDPLVPWRQIQPRLQAAQFTENPVAAFKEAEVCLITTSAPEFRFVEKMLATPSKKLPVVVDGRRMFGSSVASNNKPYVGIGMGLSPLTWPVNLS